MGKILRYMVATTAFVALSFTNISAENPDFGVARNMEVLFNLFRNLDVYYVDKLDPDELSRKAAEGMLLGLDPYTEFMTEDQMERFEILTRGKYGGIGSVIRSKGDWGEIAEPYKGSAADKAGLKIGDKIISIEGQSMKGKSPDIVSSLMKGDPGTVLNLTVERFETGLRENVSITRERVEVPGVSFYGMLNDSVGCIVYDTFSEDSASGFKHAVMELKNSGMTSLIIDMRNNGGGILTEAVTIAGMFLPKNTEVVSLRGRDMEVKVSYRTTSEPVAPDVKLAVLMSRNSASAAEVLAGALQDTDRAVLLGQRSYGKGLVQTTIPLGYNAYVKMTTDKYYIPSGRSTQAIDYSVSHNDGTVAYIPDSLINEFRTLNGRKVYDGRGVMPDVSVEPEYLSVFTLNLYSGQYIEDFAMEYLRRSNFRPVDPLSFRLNDEDYAMFMEFMEPREVQFESETGIVLEELGRRAEKEKYADRIAEEIEAIRVKITKGKTAELLEFRKEISRLIEDHIIMYYYYSTGVIRHKMEYDPLVAEAVSVLSDDMEYYSILKERDTARE